MSGIFTVVLMFGGFATALMILFGSLRIILWTLAVACLAVFSAIAFPLLAFFMAWSGGIH